MPKSSWLYISIIWMKEHLYILIDVAPWFLQGWAIERPSYVKTKSINTGQGNWSFDNHNFISRSVTKCSTLSPRTSASWSRLHTPTLHHTQCTPGHHRGRDRPAVDWSAPTGKLCPDTGNIGFIFIQPVFKILSNLSNKSTQGRHKWSLSTGQFTCQLLSRKK